MIAPALRWSVSFALLCALGIGCGCNGTRPMKLPDDSDSPPQHAVREPDPVPLEDAVEAARGVAPRALQTLQSMAATGQARMLGFEDPKEAQDASLDRAVPVRSVRLDDLRAYERGQQAETLLRSTSPDVLFPVRVGGRFASGITIARTERGWAPAAYGLDPVGRLLRSAGGEHQYVVRVLALNVFFGAQERDGELWFTPLEDYPQHEFRKGEAIRATEALGRLSEAARRHSGLPT